MYTLLLINPVEKKSGLGAYKTSSMTPLSLAYVAALTPEDKYKIVIIDESIETLDYPEADIVGITSYTTHVCRAYEIAQVYRKKSVPVVMGGIHVSTMPDEALNYCDAVVIGEAESSWHKVLDDFENKHLQSKYYAELLPLENMPFPNRKYMQNDHYLWGTILTSRGCPMDCSFCSVTRFNGRKFRRRKIEDVISELLEIKNKFVLIVDDNILGHEVSGGDKDTDGKRWLEQFFIAIVKNKIKKYFYVQASLQLGENVKLLKLAYKAGVHVALIGIESVELDSLKIYNKNLNAAYVKKHRYLELIKNIRKSGIVIVGCFILGCDNDTVRSFKKTLDFILESRIDILQITKPTPLPGTKFYNELYEHNRIIDTNYPDAWKHYKFTRMLFKPLWLEIKEVYQGVYYIKKNYYAFRTKMKRFFQTLFDTKSIISTIIMLLLNSDIYQEYDMRELEKKFNFKY